LNFSKWPQILIYQGGSEEFSEKKFLTKELKNINSNFKLFKDDKIQTLLILYPWLSRILYHPVEKVLLPDTRASVQNSTDEKEYLNRLELELLLFEEHLKYLVSISRDRNALLILTTTPLNFNAPPKKTCPFTDSSELKSELNKLRSLLRENNPKEAFLKSSKLMNSYLGNADLLYLHGQVAKRLGKTEEALASLLKASAYDCLPWRATEVHNSLIRKVARENQVMLFDFARMMENQIHSDEAFFDEIYPQNQYYEKAMEQLGLAIKGILKL
jgi:tetratricopeptide (TPR) repeat protein